MTCWLLIHHPACGGFVSADQTERHIPGLTPVVVGSSQVLPSCYSGTYSLPLVLVRVSIALMKTPWPKINLGRKGLMWLTLIDHSLSLKDIGTGPQAELESRGRSWVGAFGSHSSGLSSYIRAPTLFLVALLYDIVISWQVSSIFWCRGHGEGIAYWLAPSGMLILHPYRTQDRSWRYDSVVKRTDYSSRVLEFNSQQPHGGSQPSVMGSDALFWCVWKQLQCTDMYKTIKSLKIKKWMKK